MMKKLGEELVPLHHISGSNASFAVYNSPLTESAIVGYEFGYNLEDQKALRFGKHNMETLQIWHKLCLINLSHLADRNGVKNLVLYYYYHMHHEGQGPEHSSARLERFLQLCG